MLSAACIGGSAECAKLCLNTKAFDPAEPEFQSALRLSRLLRKVPAVVQLLERYAQKASLRRGGGGSAAAGGGVARLIGQAHTDLFARLKRAGSSLTSISSGHPLEGHGIASQASPPSSPDGSFTGSGSFRSPPAAETARVM